jgi:hypothetical protein
VENFSKICREYFKFSSNLARITDILPDDQYIFMIVSRSIRRSQWPRDLRRRSTAARLLRSWVQIPTGAWMFVCCVCCVLSGRGLCDELVTRPEENYRLWRVVVCDQETSWTRGRESALGCRARENNNNNNNNNLVQFIS